MVQREHVSFLSSHGEVLSGVLHHPSEPRAADSVILCHGMESDKNSQKLIHLSQALAGRGILTLRFDFAYVGESSGKFADITYAGEVEDLSAAYALMRSRQMRRIAIFGSSMGGTVALLFAAREPEVAALVTLAAPLHPENFPKRILTAKQIQRWREQGFTVYNGRRLNLSLLEELETIDVPAAARKIRCPVLILHGDADEVVPVEEAYELHACLAASKRLSIRTGADHRFSDPADMRLALGEALDWLSENVR